MDDSSAFESDYVSSDSSNPDRYKRRYLSPSLRKQRDARSEARRDRDRILYSVEFQRLSGVTQVVSPTERFPVHNRLTHSLKVSQVGRAIAEQVLQGAADGGLSVEVDPDVVEAACLAHDLGHPPFGHNTEGELDALLWDEDRPAESTRDGFEGNAQSFRVVTKTAIRFQVNERIPGLNLTRATLNALLKYPVMQSDTGERISKWGSYASERDDFEFARLNEAPQTRSLEAEIMNLADDISYAVHDVEDFVRVGLIPAGVFTPGSDERQWFVDWVLASPKPIAREHLDLELDNVGLSRFRGGHDDHALLSEFRSSMVDHFITSVRVSEGETTLVPTDVQREIDILQALTRCYVIESPAVQSQRFGQRQMIRTIFHIYFEQASTRPKGTGSRPPFLQIFPQLWRDRIGDLLPNETAAIKRQIADLLASMTEQQVCDTHAKLTGQIQGSVVDPIA